MACCCTNIVEICKVSICGTNALIKTGAVALAAGNYKLVLEYLDVDIVLNATFGINDDLNFPSDQLNEHYKYRGKIYGPDGSVVTITVNDVVYDCIEFKTVLEYTLVPEEEV